MMKRLLLFSLIIVLFVVSSCTRKLKGETEQTYFDGTPKLISYYTTDDSKVLVKQESYYKNKQLRMEGYFKNGEKHGKWVYYYEDGVMWSRGYFKNGVIDGKNESFHHNGQLSIIGSIDNGIRVGNWYYYDENGVLEKEINYDE